MRDMKAVIVDTSPFQGRWGQPHYRVYVVVPWFWLAKLFCNIWVANNTYGSATIMTVVKLEAERALRLKKNETIPLMETTSY